MEKVFLVGPAEIRGRLRVSRQRAHQVMHRDDFPRPYQVLPMGTVWDAADVERWIRQRRPHLAPERIEPRGDRQGDDGPQEDGPGGEDEPREDGPGGEDGPREDRPGGDGLHESALQEDEPQRDEPR